MRSGSAIETTREGVSFRGQKGVAWSFAWSAVELIQAYKIAPVTTDKLCVELVANDQSHVVDEETDGWDSLANQMAALFPIADSWVSNIVQPPFATNRGVLWARTVHHAVIQLTSAQVSALWAQSERDFENDGSLRDIYVSETTKREWNDMLAIARGMFGAVTVTSLEGRVNGELSSEHFGGNQLASATFQVGAIGLTAYCFNEFEIELSFWPHQIHSSSELGSLLRFNVAVAAFLGRRVLVTPENAPEKPIFVIHKTGEIEFLPPAFPTT